MTIPLSILTAHFVGDFILQSDWMATNKSKNWWALGLHCLVYSLTFFWWGPTFVIATFCLHFLTDAVTSRITSALWFFKPLGGPYKYWVQYGGNRHYFFVMIGLDQLIHYATLGLTLRLLS